MTEIVWKLFIVANLERLDRLSGNFSSHLCLTSQATDVRYNNKGAYIVLEGPDFSVPQFFEFEAVQPRPKVTITSPYLL